LYAYLKAQTDEGEVTTAVYPSHYFTKQAVDGYLYNYTRVDGWEVILVGDESADGENVIRADF